MKKAVLAVYRFVVKLVPRWLRKIPPVRHIGRCARSLVTGYLAPSTPVDVLGHTMYLDPQDFLSILTYGRHEPLTTEIIKRQIKANDIVLDIGAHIGYHTLTFARHVGGGGRVFAFEPAPDFFRLLQKNIEVNGYNNVVLVQKAASDKNEKCRLRVPKGPPWGRYLKPTSTLLDCWEDSSSVEVEAVRLDDYVKDYVGKIDFIKLDVEGAEGRALRGMSDIVAKSRNVKMLAEFCPFFLEQSGIGAVEYLKMLASYGFRLFDINEQANSIIPMSAAGLLELYAPETMKFTNLWCVRSA